LCDISAHPAVVTLSPVRMFEDFQPGMVFQLGSYTLDRDELVEFARRYDPQPIHIDAEAADNGPFKGLIASGWQTGAIFMRMYVETVLTDADGRGSPGLDEVRWRHPVRPGDTLTGTVTVLQTYPSERNPTRGTVVTLSELRNQDGVVVMTVRARGLFGRRA
jgi:acyl dehydratase